MGALNATKAAALVDASHGTATLTAPTTPMKLRLMTANGSATSAGTEVTGGSYASQTITMAAASTTTGLASSNVAATYTSMPAATIVGVEEWDSTGTPVRWWWGALSANKTTNSGDTFTIASGSYTTQLN